MADDQNRTANVAGGVIGVLIFAILTGIISLFKKNRGKNTGDEDKLTDVQLKSLNDLKDNFVKLQQSISGHSALAPILTKFKELAESKSYNEIDGILQQEINADSYNLLLINNFEQSLQYVLSEQFISQSNNSKAQQSQVFFLKYKDLPDVLKLFIGKRNQILALLQKGFGYISAEGLDDFKPEDSELLKSYMTEFQQLDKQATSLLATG